jgi:hypothetical protein
MKTIDALLIAAALSLVLYVYYTRKAAQNDTSFNVLMNVTHALINAIDCIYIDNNPVVFWFKTPLAMDELLRELSRMAPQYGYEYVYHSCKDSIARFSFEREGEKLPFKIRKHPSSSDESQANTFVYCLEPV